MPYVFKRVCGYPFRLERKIEMNADMVGSGVAMLAEPLSSRALSCLLMATFSSAAMATGKARKRKGTGGMLLDSVKIAHRRRRQNAAGLPGAAKYELDFMSHSLHALMTFCNRFLGAIQFQQTDTR